MKVEEIRYFRTENIFESQLHRKFRKRVNSFDLTQFSLIDGKQYEAMLRFLDLKAGMRVLDLGCGVGRIAYDVYKRTGASVIGIDINPHMLKHGIETFGNDIEFLEKDMEELTFPPESVDAIYCIDSLVFAKNIESLVRKIINVLKENGKLAVFWGQRVKDNEDRRILEPENTSFARTLPLEKVRVDHICYTEESIRHWIETKAALEEMKEDFRSEGESRMYHSLNWEADYHMDFNMNKRSSRYLYLIKKI